MLSPPFAGGVSVPDASDVILAVCGLRQREKLVVAAANKPAANTPVRAPPRCSALLRAPSSRRSALAHEDCSKQSKRQSGNMLATAYKHFVFSASATTVSCRCAVRRVGCVSKRHSGVRIKLLLP